ncbi:Alcohol dehydrogenase transcription factor Myb/SANT-like [Popillia japonica]|uniref:Alcohol dehydrogenase transcription factor Myb/SANT-like n=1 Tax=Popillia japonica TaxID=7064 RepID=A0AAW1JV83_POPJA
MIGAPNKMNSVVQYELSFILRREMIGAPNKMNSAPTKTMAAKKDDDRKFIIECIEMYHSLPALWNVKTSCKIRALVKNINSLRTNFREEVKRINSSERSGAGTDDISEVWYFNDMKFLIGQEEPSLSQNSMQIEEAEENEDDDASPVNNK